MNPSELESRLKTRRIGRRVLWFESTGSTNDIAIQHAHNPANEGLVVLAEEQTVGRGRRGRRWLSPRRSAILCSALLFPPERLNRPVVLTALAAVAVSEAITQVTGLQPQIKWPNDVQVLHKKVCGILVEQNRGTILGIGINVNTPAEAFAAEDLVHAASLAVLVGKPVDRQELLVTLLERLDRHYEELLAGGLDGLEAAWRERSGLAGRRVVVHHGSGLFLGQLREMTFDGLAVEEADGQVHLLEPERVEHVIALEDPA
jgi:BirA family biotin operon repressor/biotin-[acetyl-CoA-carboxylase] ligase